jgi:L-ascorbate metabolism protein UlaG (beta-lactamase superfamily)
VRLTWYGHACFRLEGSGLTIVCDPYTPETSGLAAPREPADWVVMSSALDDAHSCWQAVQGSPRVLNALDAVRRPVTLGAGVDVTAIAAMEGEDRPDEPKANAMYLLTLDGVAVCHMGDVGRALTEEQLAALRGRVDVLLALAGARETIPLADLDRALAEIGPKLVVPMHYQTPRVHYTLGPLEDFLVRHDGERVVHHRAPTLELTPDSLPDERTVVVLEPLLG